MNFVFCYGLKRVVLRKLVRREKGVHNLMIDCDVTSRSPAMPENRWQEARLDGLCLLNVHSRTKERPAELDLTRFGVRE